MGISHSGKQSSVIQVLISRSLKHNWRLKFQVTMQYLNDHARKLKEKYHKGQEMEPVFVYSLVCLASPLWQKHKHESVRLHFTFR